MGRLNLRTWEELNSVLLDVPEVVAIERREKTVEDDFSPAAQFNTLFDAEDVLEWLDFERSGYSVQGVEWIRPGKGSNDGSSATVYANDGHVTIYSDTVAGWYGTLETRTPYDPYGLFVRTFFDGDFTRAAKACMAEGIGEYYYSHAGNDLIRSIEKADAEELLSDERRSSWEPINIEREFDLPSDPPPDLFCREDKKFMLYRGRIHTFMGEPESGKSWAAQAAIESVVTEGYDALMIDFENSFVSVRDRLKLLGLSRSDIIEYFSYIRPDDPLDEEQRKSLIRFATEKRFSLIVIDGVTDGMALMGHDPNEGKDVGAFDHKFLRPLAETGAAVVQIDHVTKNTEGRGRYAIGSQQKLVAITGATFMFNKVEEFGRGMEGMSQILVTKDKPGFLHQEKKGDVFAEFWLDGRDTEKLTYSLKVPSDVSFGSSARSYIMDKMSNYLSLNPGMKKSTVFSECGVQANSSELDAAWDHLHKRGFIANDMGDRSAWRLVKPFYQIAGRYDRESRLEGLQGDPSPPRWQPIARPAVQDSRSQRAGVVCTFGGEDD